jgi:ATP-dependent DNA ligase
MLAPTVTCRSHRRGFCTHRFRGFLKAEQGGGSGYSAVRWPRVVVEVSFVEWTRDGLLRHPEFVGVRATRSRET